jgi:hypothetical protein
MIILGKFNNYVTMPYGVTTLCLVAGQRSSVILPSFSLLPRREFFAGATLVWKDKSRQADDHFQAIIYAKYMIFENETKTGGAAVSFGTRGFPEYYQKQERIESFRNYYVYFPVTFPLLNNTLSWDINPGVIVDKNGGIDGTCLDGASLTLLESSFTRSFQRSWIAIGYVVVNHPFYLQRV